MSGMNSPKCKAMLALALAAMLGGCGGNLDADRRNTHDSSDQSASGFMTGGSGGLLNFGIGHDNKAATAESALPVNAYLWRGSLETLRFMPLTSEDPYTGVIITDWWTPASSPNERFKATAYVRSRQLRADGIQVSLFRQVQQNGQWVDAPVDPSKLTELENMVLAKARELRAQSVASGS
jgi:hypothetical protein